MAAIFFSSPATNETGYFFKKLIKESPEKTKLIIKLQKVSWEWYNGIQLLFPMLLHERCIILSDLPKISCVLSKSQTKIRNTLPMVLFNQVPFGPMIHLNLKNIKLCQYTFHAVMMQCQNLKELTLSDINFSLKNLCNKELQKLEIVNSKLPDFQFLRTDTLQSFVLKNCSVGGPPINLEHFTKLETLKLRNRGKNKSALRWSSEKMPASLKRLSLANFRSVAPKFFYHATQLQQLSLKDIDEVPELPPTLTSLEKLTVSSMKVVDMSCLLNLQELVLKDCELGPKLNILGSRYVSIVGRESGTDLAVESVHSPKRIHIQLETLKTLYLRSLESWQFVSIDCPQLISALVHSVNPEKIYFKTPIKHLRIDLSKPI